MRIAYVSTILTSPWGGSEELWYQSAKEAVAQHHQLGLFIYSWRELPFQIKELQKAGAILHRRNHKPSFKTRLLIKLSIFFSKKTPDFLNPFHSLLIFNPDIIIVTDGSTYYAANDDSLSDLLLKRFQNKYVIISQANTDYHLPANRQKAISLFENSLQVFFVSEENRKMALHQLAYTLSKSSYIQNPILLPDFNYRPYHQKDHLVHCAVVGRFDITNKGQDILIAMMNESYWRNSNVVLHLYGQGADKNYLQNLIEYYKLTDKVFIEGFANDRNIIWDKCACLLMCSHIEGTPLTVLEAMVAGRVCIVTKVGGNAEWIEDGRTGFLVDAPVKEIFSAKLKQAMEAYSEWNTIGKTAHDQAMRKMDVNPGKTLLDRIMRNYRESV
jgi:glycosyltransferase involved in cell wall biosynthesis